MFSCIRIAIFLLIFVSPGFAQTAKSPVAKRDPADMLYRRAPTAAASRSIVVPLATNLHLAFDADLLRTHTVWNGPGLNLKGPPYTGKKTPFICTIDGPTLWTMPPFSPWRVGKALPDFSGKQDGSPGKFKAIATGGEVVSFLYEIKSSTGKGIHIKETPQLSKNGMLLRRFEIAPSDETIWFIAHAEMGTFVPDKDDNALRIQGTNGILVVRFNGASNLKWHSVESDVEYEVERITEEGSVKGNPRDHVKGRQSRAYLEIPSHSETLIVEVATTVGEEKFFQSPEKIGANSKSGPAVFSGEPSARRPVGGDSTFRIEHFPLPKEIDLLVSGMDWMPDGTLAVSTWPGEIYIVENPQGSVEKATYRRFARGLNEPMGLKVVDGKIYVAQKAELTRVLDTDGNGEAEFFETINADWGYSGHYDAFAFGPALDKSGNFVIAFEGHMGRWDVAYPGWAVKVSNNGTRLEGICHGLRAPNGIAAFGPERDIFVSDNQGNWIGACKLNHIRPGKFFGFPSSYPAPKDLAPKKFDPPAIWFPRSLSPSTTDMVEIKDERFGPFVGQMIVGDFQNALLMRVMLEKVNGEYQGAVWPFAKGFFSGVNRLSFGPDGKLYVGGCQRAWSSTVPHPYSLDRVSYTGKLPFEIENVRALPNGFELRFTQPVDVETAGNPDNFDVTQFTYLYHERYGSPEIDHDGNENSSTTITIRSVSISDDRKIVTLTLDGWREGYVTVVRCLDLQNEEGKPLRNDTFHYTLNQIPK